MTLLLQSQTLHLCCSCSGYGTVPSTNVVHLQGSLCSEVSRGETGFFIDLEQEHQTKTLFLTITFKCEISLRKEHSVPTTYLCDI